MKESISSFEYANHVEQREKPRLLSMDFWYDAVVHGNEAKEEAMLKALKAEKPNLCSVTLERSCNLQCSHCVYKPEKSSAKSSRETNLTDKVVNVVKQLQGKRTALLHEGRILAPWHLDLLAAAKEARPDLRIGLIDNGTFVKHLHKFKEAGVKLDWLDISVDGMKEAHNRQRKSDTAWDTAVEGLRRGREIISENGKVNSLFTLTNINFQDPDAVANFVLSKNLVDELHFTTMSPAREELQPFEITTEQLEVAWKQIVIANEAKPKRVYFRLYRHPDLAKLAKVVGEKRIWEILTNQRRTEKDFLLGVEVGKITFVVDGVPVTFSPLSVWPQETFLIDADGEYRTAYSIGYTLEELNAGKSRSGEDIRGFTVDSLNDKSNFSELYEKCVDQWWEFRGKKYFEEEKQVFSKIKQAF